MIIERCSRCGKKLKEKVDLIFWQNKSASFTQLLCEKCSKREYLPVTEKYEVPKTTI